MKMSRKYELKKTKKKRRRERVDEKKKDEEEGKRKRKNVVYIWRRKAAVSAKAAMEWSGTDTSQSIMENIYSGNRRKVVNNTIVLL